MMRIVAVANQKGGCGKTTTAINLASGLSLHGQRVLLVDMDPQGHASLGLNVRAQDLGLSMYDLLHGLERTEILLNDIILPMQENLDLAPANILLASVEQKMAGWPDRYQRLTKGLRTTSKTYDYVVVDCPPHLGLLTLNAMVAAQLLLIPLEASFFSLHGITNLFHTAEYLKEEMRHVLDFRIVPTMFDKRSRFAKEVLLEIRNHFMGRVYDTVVRSNIKLREAASHGRSIFAYAPGSIGALDFGALTKEVLAQPFPQAASGDVLDRHACSMNSPEDIPRAPLLSEQTKATAEEIQTFLERS